MNMLEWYYCGKLSLDDFESALFRIVKVVFYILSQYEKKPLKIGMELRNIFIILMNKQSICGKQYRLS